jgi:hypothetical protein
MSEGKSFQRGGDFKNLNQFLCSIMKLGDGSVKVGVLRKKTHRQENSKNTNAFIGMVHEFGSPSRHIPVRSWLRMPLEVKSEQIVKQLKPVAKELLAKGKPQQILKLLGAACVGMILDAFDSAGFGTWPPDKPRTIAQKSLMRNRTPAERARIISAIENVVPHRGIASPLMDTGQLRQSVAFEVSGK